MTDYWISPLGDKIRFKWYASETLPTDLPITQSWAVCVTPQKKVLIVKHNNWMLPGGTIENGETPMQTLQRELLEEINSTMKSAHLIGYQRLDYVDSNKKPHYQLRYVVILDKIGPPKLDPATGKVLERKEIDLREFHKYFQWGSIGDEIVKLTQAKLEFIFRHA